MLYRYDIQADICVADLLQIVENVADSWQISGKVSGVWPVHKQSPIKPPPVTLLRDYNRALVLKLLRFAQAQARLRLRLAEELTLFTDVISRIATRFC